MLSVKNIHQYYGGSHILRDVSLEVPPGEVTWMRRFTGVSPVAASSASEPLKVWRTRSFACSGVKPSAVKPACIMGSPRTNVPLLL